MAERNSLMDPKLDELVEDIAELDKIFNMKFDDIRKDEKNRVKMSQEELADLFTDIYERVNSEKPFMGLTTFEGELPTKHEAQIAKNYLTESELKMLNGLVSGYFDFAEVHAEKHKHLYMKDYLQHLDKLLTVNDTKVLQGSGKVSHGDAMKKVDQEYLKFQSKTLNSIERAYLESIKLLDNTTKKLKKS